MLQSSAELEEQQKLLTVNSIPETDMSEPTFGNFIEYVEKGSSHDKDPHHPESEDDRKARHKLIKATVVCFLFMLVEVAGGYMAGSLAIMTDAAHLLSDVAGFLISLFALYLSNRKATLTLSYGFKRAEIVGAVLSVMLIWFLTGILLWEAILRTQGILQKTRESRVDGKIMFVVASFGLVANITLLCVLGHDHSHGPGGGHGHSHGAESGGGDHGHSHSHGESNKHDLETHGHGSYQSQRREKKEMKRKETNINVTAAYVHAIGDLIQSVGVCIAGALIWGFPENRMMQLADPIATFLFSILVLYSTYEIMKTSINVLMEGVPKGINPGKVARDMLSIPGVIGAHHLHIWSLTVGEPSLSVHLVVDDGVEPFEVLAKAQHVLREKNLGHSTIQIEPAHSKKLLCAENTCHGDPCSSFAIRCHDSGNCFDAVSVDPGLLSPDMQSNKASHHGHSH